MIYDIVVVGGGPAGLSAGIYAKRAGRNVLVIEKFLPGGQLNLIGQIENYLGFSSISGSELAEKFTDHALSQGLQIITDEVINYDLDGQIKTLSLRKGQVQTKSVILSQGCFSRELGIEGEKEYKGRGVSYCALCDGNFFKGKSVAIVGSGDSAFSDAIYLSNLCKQVYLLTKPTLKLHNYAENELDDKNVIMLRGAMSQKIEGDNNSVKKLCFVKDGKQDSIEVDGVFVAIGRTPDTSALRGKIDMTDYGYILCDDKMRTSVQGVFACGDVREGSIRQISTAVGEGAIAGTEASKYVLLSDYKTRG